MGRIAHATEPAEIIAIYGRQGGRMHLAEVSSTVG